MRAKLRLLVLYNMALFITAITAAAAAAAVNDRPIIGLLTLPNDQTSLPAGTASYVPASYARWLEAAGARVAPLRFDSPPAVTRALLKGLNGVLFPGGAASFFNGDGSPTAFTATAQLAYEESVAAAAAGGEAFPLWGTCLGHELLLLLASGLNRSVLTAGFDAEYLLLPLDPAPAAPRSRTWGSMIGGDVPGAFSWMTAEAITVNLHSLGVAPADFAGAPPLARDFEVLATNVDRAGRPFVSSFEGRALPIYGSQFHPEKPQFEFTGAYPIPHGWHALAGNGALARFFVNETKRSARAFASPAEENAALLYNWPLVFTAASGDDKLARWESVYVFEAAAQEVEES